MLKKELDNRWYMNAIIHGHVLDVLPQLPAECVDAIITSPAYFGLRNYGEETAAVWGGKKECNHQWGNDIPGDSKGGSGTPTGRNNRGEGYARGMSRGCYCLRCRAWQGQLGREPNVELYIAHLVEIFQEVKRVLKEDGTLWLVLGSTYASDTSQMLHPPVFHNRDKVSFVSASQKPPNGFIRDNITTMFRNIKFKPKDLIPIPWMVAMALQADGWWLRKEIIWAKGLSFCPAWSGNVMPESTADRPVSAHETIFLFSKSPTYYYDRFAVRDPIASSGRSGNVRRKAVTDRRPVEAHTRVAYSIPWQDTGIGRNLRDVWCVNIKPLRGIHFATFPLSLIEPIIRLATSEKGCCAKCGAPWHRSVVKTQEVDRSAKGSRFDRGKTAQHQLGRAQPGERYVTRPGTWQPGCACGTQVVTPAVVLDPFLGSGTTAVAASRLGRLWIGIEANGEYCNLAAKRINEAITGGVK